MASRPAQARRSLSFEILSHDSPGDGDTGRARGEKTENKARRRRRRRSRSRKLSVGDLSPLLPFHEESDPVSPNPAGGAVLRSTAPPQKGSLRALGVNSPLFWENGTDFPTDSSRPASARAANGPTTPSVWHQPIPVPSAYGAFSRGEFRVEDEAGAVSRIEESPSSSAHERSSLAEDMPKFGRHAQSMSPRVKQETDEFFSDPAVLGHTNAPGSSDIGSIDANERKPPSEAALTPVPTNIPDFSSATEGLAEPAFIRGALPHTELRQRMVDRTSSDKEGEKSGSNVSNGQREQRSWKEDNLTTSADERLTPQAGKTRWGGEFSTPQLKDWESLMAENARHPPLSDLSPMQYLVTEVCSGSTLRNTTSVGTEQKRDRVYNTMFHVPWRCELLIDVGFVVCLDAFLSLFTIMPARIIMFIWQRLTGFVKGRQLHRLYAAELCDFGCLLVLVVGVAILMQADISIMYHWIRGQGVVKLYVVFNVLEIFDKLCQSFGADVLQVLFNSAVSVECCKGEHLSKEMARFAFDQCIAIVSFFVHSLVIISQAITISAAVNAQNNALLTLLISNNFAEIKSNVFKRMGTDQLHKMAYHDTVERFHIMTHVLFVWAQNVLNTEESLWPKFFYNAGMVFFCEVMVDVIKHSFLAKFNEVKPAAYSEFLQALCKQTLNSQSHEVHKTLTFVPLAPACVVMRILLPVYAAFVPEGPKLWRWPRILLQGGLTYVALVLVKVMVGLGLQAHAKWYLNRHPWSLPHPHFE